MPADPALTNSRAMALVGVSDLDQARAFYQHTLGLHIVSADGYALVAEAGGVRIRLTQAAPVHPAPYTVLGFEVPDAQATLSHLAQSGIRFERYPFLGTSQADDGLWQSPAGTRVAWFKDPDGNLLSISDAPPA